MKEAGASADGERIHESFLLQYFRRETRWHNRLQRTSLTIWVHKDIWIFETFFQIGDSENLKEARLPTDLELRDMFSEGRHRRCLNESLHMNKRRLLDTSCD